MANDKANPLTLFDNYAWRMERIRCMHILIL